MDSECKDFIQKSSFNVLDILLGYESIGFDMDGTLYDEFIFIKQAYGEISSFFKENFTQIDSYNVFCFMVQMWVKFGSGYKFIFRDTIKEFITQDPSLILELEKKSLIIYRSACPKIYMPERNIFILDQLVKKGIKLFLITDGNLDLQIKKAESLNLGKWFAKDSIVMTAQYGAEHYKPSVKAYEVLLQNKILKRGEKTVFVGDRLQDKAFAERCSIDFVLIRNGVIS